MAVPPRSALTHISAGSQGAAERQLYGCATVLELNVMMISFLHVN
jgi:hypothetical protein